MLSDRLYKRREANGAVSIFNVDPNLVVEPAEDGADVAEDAVVIMGEPMAQEAPSRRLVQARG